MNGRLFRRINFIRFAEKWNRVLFSQTFFLFISAYFIHFHFSYFFFFFYKLTSKREPNFWGRKCQRISFYRRFPPTFLPWPTPTLVSASFQNIFRYIQASFRELIRVNKIKIPSEKLCSLLFPDISVAFFGSLPIKMYFACSVAIYKVDNTETKTYYNFFACSLCFFCFALLLLKWV